MVNLSEYENYWNNMLARVPALKEVYFVTIESDIQSILSDIKPDIPFLMVVVPSSESKGNYDNAEEDNLCLLYLYQKEDKQRSSLKQTFGIQKQLQPVLEQIKFCMREDSRTCNIMRNLNFDSMHTDPERKMSSILSGWSMSFQFESQ